MYRILIVEDDPVISAAVNRGLTAWGYDVRETEEFHRVTALFDDCAPHLVLMDISLPFCDGFYWCREIRKKSKVPVLFLSSASDNMNIVMAMNMGGDDFIAKPFDMSVLVAKVGALLRRAYDFGGQTGFPEHRGARLDTSAACLLYGGKRITLTRNEYRILLTLLQRKGSVVSRSTLMEQLWETDCYVDENTLTVNMTRLRRKLEAEGLPDFIVTRKGMGYLIGGED